LPRATVAEPAESAAPFVPATRSLARLRAAAAGCRGCDLFERATQTVFGEGPRNATLMFVGEQPGDSEDRVGHPFVGPAGKLLRDGLARAGIAPDAVYMTNAVKHFRFVERGKRRIHAKPRRIEIDACMPWLEAEIRVIRPELVVALGATAAGALLGGRFRLTEMRGKILTSPLAERVLATWHPSAILRAPDADARAVSWNEFLADLQTAAAAASAAARP
jgi:uracil-DNA glycosylase